MTRARAYDKNAAPCVNTVIALWNLLCGEDGEDFESIVDRGEELECSELLDKIIKTIPTDLYGRMWACPSKSHPNDESREEEVTYADATRHTLDKPRCPECDETMVLA